MKHIDSYSYFLMDVAFNSVSMINEADYEWDFKNNVEIDHKNKTVKWLERSLKKSNNKASWYRRFLSKISNLSPKVKKAILISVIPLVISSMDLNDVENITDQECTENSIEKDLVSMFIEKYPNTNKIKKELSDKYKEEYDKEISKSSSKKSFDDFMKDLAQRESSGNWKVSNEYGYMGLYQIGRTALKDVSQRTKDPELKDLHKKINKKRFDKNPNIFPVDLQNKVFKQLLRNNKHYLRKYTSYIGKTIDDIYITESGLLAASHLVGNNAVKEFLRSNGKRDISDKNGVKCSEYLKKFSNYNIQL